MKSTVLDRIAGIVSPTWQANRLRGRAQVAALTEATAYFDGATRNHRTAGRRISSTSANREAITALPRLRDVSRDQARNNPYARRALDVLGANMVGPGIVASVKGPTKRLQTKVAELVAAHLETPAIDLDGRHNIYGLQKLVMRSMAESGEALIVRYRPPASLKLKVPLQVRVLEPDYISPFQDTSIAVPGNRVIQGIEFDKAGRRLAYHLFDEHPGDWLHWNFPKSRRVPAEDVIHVYRVDRPGQIRGIPWGAPAIMTIWDFGDFEDAELMRQKIAACFAVFWTDANNATTMAGKQGAPPSQTGAPVDFLEPGMQQRLPPGVDVKFATPPGTHGYEAYTRAQIRKIGLSYGVPYESISGDLTGVNFSSGRLGWLDFQRLITQTQWEILIPHACVGMASWFLDAAEFAVPGASRCTLAWTEPRREMIDPKTEIAAARDAIRSGLSTRSAELRKLGEDPEQTDQENHDDQARADKLKLRFDSDGRHGLQEPAALRGPAALAPVADPETGDKPGDTEKEDQADAA